MASVKNLILFDIIKGQSIRVRYDINVGQVKRIHKLIDKLQRCSYSERVLLTENGQTIKNQRCLNNIGTLNIIFFYDKSDMEMSTEELLDKIKKFPKHNYLSDLAVAGVLEDPLMLVENRSKRAITLTEDICKLAYCYLVQNQKMLYEYRKQCEGWSAVMTSYNNYIEKLHRKYENLLENMDYIYDSRASFYKALRKTEIFINEIRKVSSSTLPDQCGDSFIKTEDRMFDQSDEENCDIVKSDLDRVLCNLQVKESANEQQKSGFLTFLRSDSNLHKLSFAITHWIHVLDILNEYKKSSLRVRLEKFRKYVLMDPILLNLTGTEEKLEYLQKLAYMVSELAKHQFILTKNLILINVDKSKFDNVTINSMLVALFTNNRKLEALSVQFITEKRLLVLRIFQRMQWLIYEWKYRKSYETKLRGYYNVTKSLPTFVKFIRQLDQQFEI